MSFNKVTLIGNLGCEPQLKYTPQGKAVCEFTVATSQKKASSGETKEDTVWFNITVWDRQAEIARSYLTKGKQVYVEGPLRIEQYVDKSGKPRYSLEVTANHLELIGNRPESLLPTIANNQLELPNLVASKAS
jgi:single-strand DNA-binding protein